METTTTSSKQPSNSLIDNINIGLIYYLVKKTLPIIILFIVIASALGFFYLKYTNKIYQAKATLLLQEQKQQELLGVNDLTQIENFDLNREIQFMRSKTFIERALDSLNLDVQYFQESRLGILNTEFYKNSPLNVDQVVRNKEIYGTKIFVNIISNQRCEITYELNKKKIVKILDFDKEESDKNLKLTIHYKRALNPKKITKWFIVIQSHDDVVNEITRNLYIQPIDVVTKRVLITYNNTVPDKAYDIISSLSYNFMEYNRERKAKGFTSVLNFLDNQIRDIGEKYFNIQDSLNDYSVKNNVFDLDKKDNSQADELKDIDKKTDDIQLGQENISYIYSYLIKHDDINLINIIDLESKSDGKLEEIVKIKELLMEKKVKILDINSPHPDIRIIDDNILLLKKQLIKRLENTTYLNKRASNNLQTEKANITENLKKIPEINSKINQIQNQRDLYEGIYSNLISKRTDYQIGRAAIVSDFIMIE